MLLSCVLVKEIHNSITDMPVSCALVKHNSITDIPVNYVNVVVIHNSTTGIAESCILVKEIHNTITVMVASCVFVRESKGNSNITDTHGDCVFVKEIHNSIADIPVSCALVREIHNSNSIPLYVRRSYVGRQTSPTTAETYLCRCAGLR